MSMANGGEEFELALLNALQPMRRLSVSEWADEHRVLSSKDSAEAGRYRTDRTPNLREIMDELSNFSIVQSVTVKKAAQVGCTTLALNFLGYIISENPGMTMIVWPTLPDAKKNSKIRLDPLIEETPILREKVSQGKNRDSKNTGMYKDFKGGALVVSGAQSASALRSVPAKFVVGDEVDAFPDSVGEEGGPVELLEARQRTYPRRKALWMSTPTFKGSSKIHKLWLKSDQRWFYVLCPYCKEAQILGHEDADRPLSTFDHLKYESEMDADGQEIVTKASMFCKKCGEEIEEYHKPNLFKFGKWVKHNPKSAAAGFHISGVYSPLGWFSWKDLCQDYVNAKNSKDPDKMMAFVNLSLGEVYAFAGDKPAKELLYDRKEHYEVGTVQKGAYFLTCAVDVQDQRLEAEVMAWGRGKERWVVERRIIIGDTKDDDTWDELEEYITQTFTHVDGFEMPILKTAVDSSWRTAEVYTFCRRFDARRVVPIKGVDDLPQVFAPPKQLDVKDSGRRIRRGINLWKVGTNMLKSELYGDLQKTAPLEIGDPFPAGFIHFPMALDREYFEQLVAEERRLKRNKKGKTVVEWHQLRDRNETLDLHIYNRAAAAMVGIDRMKEAQWQKLLDNISVVKSLKREENGSNTSKKKKSRKDRDDFWTGDK